MNDSPKQITGRYLNSKWNVGAKHALYRKDGTWYHKLREFPGALFDANGYIVFENAQDLVNCKHLHIKKQITPLNGISNIPGYIQVTEDIQQQTPKDQNKTNRELDSCDLGLVDIIQKFTL